MAVGIFLLWYGAEWIVDSASAVARRFQVSELVIGLTVVAMGTSAPEFLVTFTAALKGMADISLANVVGSDIFNLGMILGLMALIRPIPTHPTLLWRDGGMLFAVVAATLLMARDGTLSHGEGVVLTATFVGYLGWLIVRRRHGLPDPTAPDEADDTHRKAAWTDYPKLLLGFGAISLGSNLLVDGASFVALRFGVSQWAIGLTIVGAGTSLPELVTCLSASLKGKNDMLLGNLVGSDFFNFAGVLGVTCLMRPLAVSAQALPGLYVLVGAVALVLLFMRTGWRISRVEAVALIVLNLFRWGMAFA
ncbi:MAG: calcium/sodium antiporter [Desulfovibrionaceae bacterium]